MLRVNVITGFIKDSMSPALLRTRDILWNPQVDVEGPVINQDTWRHIVTNLKALMTASCHILRSVFSHLHCCLQTEVDGFKWRMHNQWKRQQAMSMKPNQIGRYGFKFYHHCWFDNITNYFWQQDSIWCYLWSQHLSLLLRLTVVSLSFWSS